MLASPAGAEAQGIAPLTAPARITSTGPATDFQTGAEAPVLSYDRVSRRVLALWQVRGSGDTLAVRGRILDARGQTLGAQFVLPGFQVTTTALAVAARPRAGGWVVVAGVEVAARATRIVSTTMEPNGVPGRRRGISPPAPFAGAGISSPAVAFAPRSRRAVIGWFLDGRHGRGGVYARGVDTRGRPTGPVHAVFRSPKGASSIDGRLALGFAPATRRWVVVWRYVLGSGATHPPGMKNLRSRRVLSDGRPRGPIQGLAIAGPSGTPVLVTDAGGGRPLVLYARQDDADPNFRLQLLRLDRADAAIGRPRTLALLQEPSVAISPSVVSLSSGGMLVSYVQACQPAGHESCPQFSPVLGRVLTATGSPAGAAGVLVADAVGRAASLVATGPRSALMAWAGALLSGSPFEDPTAQATVYPHKSEIFVRALSR